MRVFGEPQREREWRDLDRAAADELVEMLPGPIVVQVSSRSPEALDALRAYVDEMFDRGIWRGDPDETEQVDEFAPPGGAFVIARSGRRVIGCGGILTLSPEVAELKRMWVSEDRRGQGVGWLLLDALEALAQELGFQAIRLDTNRDLTDAIRLYERNGFTPISPYNDSYDATHFYEKPLGLPAG